jgi:hypothetical protein
MKLLLLLNKRSDETQNQRAKRSYLILRKPQKKNSSFHLVKMGTSVLFSFFFFFLFPFLFCEGGQVVVIHKYI